MEFIKLMDSIKMLGIKPSDNLDEISAKFMEAFWLLEAERAKIREAIMANQKLQTVGQGGNFSGAV